jgi:DNA-3-methyladenine glycosylase II
VTEFPLSGGFELVPRGPFSLAANAEFLEGFVPSGRQLREGPGALAHSASGHVHFAFVAEGHDEASGVCLREVEGWVVGNAYGTAGSDVVRAHVERILSLDVDGTGFFEVGERDPVVAGLQARYPSLRPLTFFTPYEAAAWALISQRIQMRQGARIKTAMAEQLGPSVEIEGETWRAFPGPGRLAQLESFPGLTGRKVEYLRGLGRAALEGRLDASRLRAIPPETALEDLKTLNGVGDFSAQLILLRGAGEPDFLASGEPRLGRAVALAYGLDGPPDASRLREISAAWRPFRTWVAFLLRRFLEDETHEIARARRAG